jgi:anti-sigma regulatory factor (Ser/Thr protein kinase)
VLKAGTGAGLPPPCACGARNLPYNPDIVLPTEARAEFPAEPASAGHARRFVDATLRQWSCDALVDVATLLVSELVSNAVLHARTTIGVTVRRDNQRVRIEVWDGDNRAPAQKHYSSMATTGRGLLLVERMSSDWGVVLDDGGGKNVWFELDEATGQAPLVGAAAGFDLAVDLDAFDDDLEPAGPPDARSNGNGNGLPGGGARNRRAFAVGVRSP